jgi:probable F420-dependent oxidoreductase
MKIGAFLPLIEDPGRTGVTSWADLVRIAQMAEEIGLDSLWFPDHLIFRHEDQPQAGVWEAMSILTGIAAVTSKVELGPLVLCAGWRNPALIAKMADTIDEISGGRFVLGLGSGWHKPEFDAFGFPFDHRYSRFEEAIRIIHGLLRNGHVDFAGKFHQARDCELRPRGPRKNGPPILIGSTGEKMLQLTAKYADMWNSDWRNSVEIAAPVVEQASAALVAAGRDLATIERTVSVVIDLPSAQGLPANRFGAMSGSHEEIAAGLRAYAALGVSHLHCWIHPNTPAGMAEFSRVLELI